MFEETQRFLSWHSFIRTPSLGGSRQEQQDQKKWLNFEPIINDDSLSSMTPKKQCTSSSTLMYHENYAQANLLIPCSLEVTDAHLLYKAQKKLKWTLQT